jgi:hypothetical protein
MSSTERTSVSLPTNLAEWARARGNGNVSSYVARLIAEDKRRQERMAMFADHGYVGDKAITEVGTAAMGERLHTLTAQRARKRAA